MTEVALRKSYVTFYFTLFLIRPVPAEGVKWQAGFMVHPPLQWRHLAVLLLSTNQKADERRRQSNNLETNNMFASELVVDE